VAIKRDIDVIGIINQFYFTIIGVDTADDDEETCCRGYFCLSMSMSIRCCSSSFYKLIGRDRDVTNS
jgi:hypothetical protein